MSSRISLPDRGRSISTVRAALDRWRSSRGRGFRIPDELWDQAVDLSGHHGVHAVSKALRLNYYSLKDRVAALDETIRSPGVRGSDEEGRAAFVEIPMVASGPVEIEVESPAGWKMRMRAPSPVGLQMLVAAGLAGALEGLRG